MSRVNQRTMYIRLVSECGQYHYEQEVRVTETLYADRMALTTYLRSEADLLIAYLARPEQGAHHMRLECVREWSGEGHAYTSDGDWRDFPMT